MSKYFNKVLAFLSILFLLILSLIIPVVPSHAAACVEHPVLTFGPATVPDEGGQVKIKGTGFCMTDGDHGIMVSLGLKDTTQFNNGGGYNGPFTVHQMVPKSQITDGAFEISLAVPAYSAEKARVLRTALWSSSSSDFSRERSTGERYALNLDIPYRSLAPVEATDKEAGTSGENPAPATCKPSPKLEVEPDPISYEGGIVTIKGSGFCEPEKFGTKQGVLVTVGRNDLGEYSTVVSTDVGKNFIRLSTEETVDSYTPDQGGNAVLAADGSFTVKLRVPAQSGDEKYAVFTSGGGYYAGSSDALDQKLTINFTEKPTVKVEPPSLEVTKAQRAGGKVHVKGKNYLAKYPGIYICVLPDSFDNLHTNADNCYEEKVLWVTPDEETNIEANIVHMNADGSFELDLKVPAFTAGKGWIVTTARAHGLAREDKSQSVNAPVVYESDPGTPEKPNPGKVDSGKGSAGSDEGKSAAVKPVQFSDVAGYPFVKEIQWLAASGVTTGYPDKTFRPHDSVSRAAMAAFLYRLEGKPDYTAPKQSPFTDIKPGDDFYKEICWLASKGITTGYADGSFKPWDSISREAMAAFLHRYDQKVAAKKLATKLAAKKFTDTGATPFAKDIVWLSQTGVTTGYADGSFKPYDPIERGAIAAFFYRMKH